MYWHQLRSHVPQVFQVTSHIVGFRSVLRVVNFNYCRCNHLLNFDLYASKNLFSLLAGIRVLLNCFVHFFNVMVGIPRVGKENPHQLDTLMFDHNRCCDGSFADVFNIDDISSHFLFSIIPTPCLLSHFPSQMSMCL